MYAVIEVGGKQEKVSTGDIIQVERLSADPGTEVELDRILLVSNDQGEISIGTPCVENVRVVAKVIDEVKGKKIIVYKHKRRKNYSRKLGHRQKYTKLLIKEIKVN